MNQAGRLHSQGFKAELISDGECITLAGMKVAAILDRQPRLLDMQDAGYLDRQPVSVEVLKGYAGSTATVWLDGQAVNMDLRGNAPSPRVTLAVIDNINKKVISVLDGVDRWILTTITLNT